LHSEALKRKQNEYRNCKTEMKREHRKIKSYSFTRVKYYIMREGLAFNIHNIENIEKKQEEELLCEIYCQVEDNYNLQANLEYEVEIMAREHNKEYESDE
jgi:uncharacterized OsmC-like protein